MFLPEMQKQLQIKGVGVNWLKVNNVHYKGFPKGCQVKKFCFYVCTQCHDAGGAPDLCRTVLSAGILSAKTPENGLPYKVLEKY